MTPEPIELGSNKTRTTGFYIHHTIYHSTFSRLQYPAYNPTEQAINRSIYWPIHLPVRNATQATVNKLSGEHSTDK